MTYGQHAPIDPVVGFTEQIKELQRRLGVLESRGSNVWQTITTFDANWNATNFQWRAEGNRVWLRGRLERTTSTLTAGGIIFAFAGTSAGNPHGPANIAEFACYRFTGVHETLGGLVAGVDGVGTFQISGVTTVDVGDFLYFDHVSWPLG